MTFTLKLPPWQYRALDGDVTPLGREYRSGVTAGLRSLPRLRCSTHVRVLTRAPEEYHAALLDAVVDALLFSGVVRRVEVGVVDQVEDESGVSGPCAGTVEVTVSAIL